MSIASYIRDDLAARLRSGGDLSNQLTLDSLAEYYKVSFTPVRAAVSELIDEGLLEKGPNRRLVAPPSAVHSQASPQKQSQPQPPRDPFGVISRDLVQLSLKGESIYLREEATAERYAISRSAIRNILHRLAGEGILDHIPRRGWRLRPFRQDDLQAYIEIREVLERKALDLAIPKLVAGDLEQMLHANRAPDTNDSRPEIDESLHEYFVNAAGNAYIKDFFERQGRYYGLLFEWEDQDHATAVETARQHREILTALLEQDWSAARKSLSHHILNNHPLLDMVIVDNKADTLENDDTHQATSSQSEAGRKLK